MTPDLKPDRKMSADRTEFIAQPQIVVVSRVVEPLVARVLLEIDSTRQVQTLKTRFRCAKHAKEIYDLELEKFYDENQQNERKSLLLKPDYIANGLLKNLRQRAETSDERTVLFNSEIKFIVDPLFLITQEKDIYAAHPELVQLFTDELEMKIKSTQAFYSGNIWQDKK